MVQPDPLSSDELRVVAEVFPAGSPPELDGQSPRASAITPGLDARTTAFARGRVELVSIEALAASLQQRRLHVGWSLEDLSQRAGVERRVVEAFEAGLNPRYHEAIGLLHDLRRCAEVLGLPGDRYVLAIVDLVAGSRGGPGSEASNGAPEAEPATGRVPVVARDTALAHPRVKRRGPRGLLQLVVAFVAVLVTIGFAWLIVNRWEPAWLQDVHLPYTLSPPGPASPATDALVPWRKAILEEFGSNATTAGFVIHASRYEVTLAVREAAASVSVVDGRGIVKFRGTLNPWASRTFSSTRTLRFHIGSIPARLTVSVASKIVGSYAPRAAPYTVIFTTDR